MIDPIRPSVWRRPSRNTHLSVNAVSMAVAEYRAWPPRVVRGRARQSAKAAGVNQIVKLPRLRRASSYDRQFRTLYLARGM